MRKQPTRKRTPINKVSTIQLTIVDLISNGKLRLMRKMRGTKGKI